MNYRSLAKQLLLRDSGISDKEAAILKQHVLEDFTVDPDEMVFLLELKHEAKVKDQGFIDLVNRVLASRVLRDNKIDADEVKWLRKLVFEDKAIHEEELEMLVHLEAEAKLVCPEYYTLLKEASDFVRGAKK